MIIALGVVAVGIISTLALVGAAGTMGDEPEPTPSPVPTASPSPTPTPEPPTPTPSPAPPNTAYHLVFREFGATEDVIWLALPADPSERVELARIPHREGFGIKASLSPDGTKLAYLSLPATALSAQSSQAEAFVMDLETKENVKIADDVDLAFVPLWSPAGDLLYMRRLAGSEFLAADVIIVRADVPPVGETTPPPTPSPAPDPSQTPLPTRPAVEEAIRDSISRVLSFIPVGFAEDELLFVQIRGGTQQGSLLASAKPATTEALEEAWNDYLELLPSPTPTGTPTPKPPSGQTATPTPSPTATPTPVPTPTLDTGFIVNLSDQITFDYDLSAHRDKLLFLAQGFTDEGVIANRAYWVDVPGRSVHAVEAEELAAGYHLRPIWHPNGQSITVGVLPFDGELGQLILMSRDGAKIENLTLSTSGFDEPRSWAPDGSWLAVSHSEGNSLANRGGISLVLVSRTGVRVTVSEGADNATVDSVLGWLKVEEE